MRALGLALAFAIGIGVSAGANETDDIAAATATLKAMFETPTNPLTAAPIVSAGNYGVADWTQGGMGGRALLYRKQNGWTIALCSGEALRSAAKLRIIGVPPAAADALADKLAMAEKAEPAARLALLASFDGTVPMDVGSLNPNGTE